MKILEHILDTIIQDQVSISNMQFGFIPGIGTTDVIFILKTATRKGHAKEEKHLLCICRPRKGFQWDYSDCWVYV